MVAFEKGQAHFNYRVAGVAIHNGHILLDRNSRNNYWVLPGGHPEMMEPMTEALRRELKEEIGAEVKVTRLLWMIENFFHKKRDIHELSFYFLMELDPGSLLLKGNGPFFGKEDKYQLTFQWYPIQESVLKALPLFPGYLIKALLLDLPEHPQHVVYNDISIENEAPSKTQDITQPASQRLTIP